MQSLDDPLWIDWVLARVRCKDAAKHGNSERGANHSRRVDDAGGRARVCLRSSRYSDRKQRAGVMRPKPMPIDKKANSIRTMSAAREIVDRASSPSPISAKPHVMISRGPTRVASLPDFKETRKNASDTGNICNPTAGADAPPTVCKNSGIRNSIAYMPNVMPTAAIEAAENARQPSSRSWRGCSIPNADLR